MVYTGNKLEIENQARSHTYFRRIKFYLPETQMLCGNGFEIQKIQGLGSLADNEDGDRHHRQLHHHGRRDPSLKLFDKDNLAAKSPGSMKDKMTGRRMTGLGFCFFS